MKFFLLTTAALSALAVPAIAQQSETEDDVRVEERIVVTMPGPSREADELIGGASVIERDDILDRLEPSLGDTLAKEPGISSTYFGPAASRPVVRGLGAERVLVLTNSSGVIDASAASPDHQVSGDGIDATRIEVLRGPAALAYGGQAIGGVVNVIDGLIAEDIPDAPNGDLLAAYNDVNDASELAARGEFAAGPIVFNLSATRRDADDLSIPGFAESAALIAQEEAEGEMHDEDEVSGTLENSFLETQTLSGGASWVGEDAFLGIAVRQTDSTYGLPGAHGHEEDDAGGGAVEEEEESPFIDLSQTRYDLRGGLHLHGSKIDRVSGALSIVDYDHTEFEAPGEPGTIFTTTGHEARLEATHKEVLGLEGTFGVQHSFKKLGADGDEAFITPTKTERFGAFLYEVRDWDNGFGVEGGLRFENTRLDNAIAGEQDFDTFSGSLGVHRHFDGGLFLGAQVAYTERAPSDTELFANGPHLATNQFELGDVTLDVETGLNFEGTARFSFDNGSIGVNLFNTEFNDFVFLTPTGAMDDDLPVFMFTQSDASFFGGEIYGETNAGLWLGADWTLNASLDFVSGELTNGDNLPLQPPTTAQLGADADWGKFAAGIDLTLAGDQDDNALGELPTDGYTLVDLSAEYKLDGQGPFGDGAKLFIMARNVTDEEARASTSVLKDVAPLPGRNIRVGVRLSF